MDTVSAKVLGSIALVFGVVFVSTSVVRLTRPDVDLLLVLLNMALGILWVGAGVRLWRFGLRKPKDDR
ncbi:hypothetical protein DEJ33_14050 [Curtobacterium sp. MCPF17_047]|uniref:hypothetical protein n=1 Tax=Curtobacterium sp. MCPF17_047 TaxID=2175654 RepID=UPI000DA89BEF|nr:hypothetical protein [Curtobacterium sp. MCPF17_047]PZF63494.1 hypothetical protein DEJ33_14050 [Curtobacterium sp. MCPF17_047]